MIAAGVPLPETIGAALGDEGEPHFAFNEIAFAVAPKRLEWSWSDFKKQQSLHSPLFPSWRNCVILGTHREGLPTDRGGDEACNT